MFFGSIRVSFLGRRCTNRMFFAVWSLMLESDAQTKCFLQSDLWCLNQTSKPNVFCSLICYAWIRRPYSLSGSKIDWWEWLECVRGSISSCTLSWSWPVAKFYLVQTILGTRLCIYWRVLRPTTGNTAVDIAVFYDIFLPFLDLN